LDLYLSKDERLLGSILYLANIRWVHEVEIPDVELG
jgi:hypothetical protein